MWITRYSTIIVTAVGAIALVMCASIVTQGLVRIKRPDEVIRITGSARKIITSDLVTWRARISARDANMATAYKTLQTGVEQARNYLLKNGLKSDEVRVLSTETQTLYALPPKGRDYWDSNVFRPIEGYMLTQGIVVQSQQVDLVDKLARGVTALMSGGVEIDSSPPEYMYTKQAELKVQMLADAAKDARNRANQIARNTGCHVAGVRYAYMGSMRIIPAYTTSESAEGVYDTSTKDKEIVATVSAGFRIR